MAADFAKGASCLMYAPISGLHTYSWFSTRVRVSNAPTSANGTPVRGSR